MIKFRQDIINEQIYFWEKKLIDLLNLEFSIRSKYIDPRNHKIRASLSYL